MSDTEHIRLTYWDLNRKHAWKLNAETGKVTVIQDQEDYNRLAFQIEQNGELIFSLEQWLKIEKNTHPIKPAWVEGHNPNTDSVERGSPTKGGKYKMYFDAGNPDEAHKRAENMAAIFAYTKMLLDPDAIDKRVEEWKKTSVGRNVTS